MDESPVRVLTRENFEDVMVKWEYIYIYRSFDKTIEFHERIETCGMNGWELVNVLFVPTSSQNDGLLAAYMKRPKAEDHPIRNLGEVPL